MTTTAITINDVLTYLTNEANAEDLNKIADTFRQRQKAVMAQRAATVTIDTTGTLANLTPKYLNGLSGTVTDVIGSRATFLLDESSTHILRQSRQRRYRISPTEERYPITGIPLSCIEAN